MQSALSAVRNKTRSHSLSPASYSSSEIQSSADAGAQNKSTDLQDIILFNIHATTETNLE